MIVDVDRVLIQFGKRCLVGRKRTFNCASGQNFRRYSVRRAKNDAILLLESLKSKSLKSAISYGHPSPHTSFLNPYLIYHFPIIS